ncbi:MAG: AAA family ATPase [Planctomycetota bacterium]
MKADYDVTERYRPRTIDEFVGNDKTVAAVRWWLQRGVGGHKFWISGPSGAGKTTLALILAHAVADPYNVHTYVGRELTPVTIKRLKRLLPCYAIGVKSGRAVVINEAHTLRTEAIELLLDLLEPVPGHVVVVATTTKAGQKKLFGEELDAGPLLGRFTPLALSNQALSEPFGQRFREIALAEGFDVPLAKAIRIVSEAHNSLRAALDWIGSTESMDYIIGDDPPAGALAVA